MDANGFCRHAGRWAEEDQGATVHDDILVEVHAVHRRRIPYTRVRRFCCCGIARIDDYC